MSEVLHVKQRTAFGTRNSDRLRKEGLLPAVLYGHGKDTMTLSLPAEEFAASLRHGARVVELDGAVKAQALLQDIQWDTFFHNVLHVDLLRVVAGERITVTVPLELRGNAPGASDGVVEQLLHEVEIEVTPANVPEKLHLNINHLELHGSMTLGEIEDMPEGAELTVDSGETAVHCIERVEEADEEVAAAGEAEPEVIGQKEDEEGESGGESQD